MSIINVNPKTGIRYGVISANSLNQDLFSEIFDKAYNDYYDYCLQAAITEAKDACLIQDIIFDEEKTIDDFADYFHPDEIDGEFSFENVKGWLTTLGGAYILYIFESPFLTTANLCSPCCQNAGNLDEINPDGYTCYDVPKEWRE